MEQKREVKTMQVDYICPKCEVGNLRPLLNALMTYPIKYPHQCNVCNYYEVFSIQYPYLEYETINL